MEKRRVLVVDNNRDLADSGFRERVCRMLAAPSSEIMDQDYFRLTCPYCGETMEVYLEPELEGSLVQDCEVCCNPWQLYVSGEGRRRRVTVSRSDGGDL